MDKNKKLIGFSGKAGAGKDTAANHLWKADDYVKLSFAAPLKTAVCSIFGMSAVRLEDRALKETVVKQWGMTPRQMMQRMGDALRREFGEDLFVRIAEMNLDALDDDDVAFSDVRFQEEADMIRRRGGRVIEIQREAAGLGGAEGEHRSEAGVEADAVVANNGTFEELYSTLAVEVTKPSPVCNVKEQVTQ